MKTKLNISQFVSSSFSPSLHRAYSVETRLNETVTTRIHFVRATARESIDAALDFCKNNVDKGLPCRVVFGKEIVADFSKPVV